MSLLLGVMSGGSGAHMTPSTGGSSELLSTATTASTSNKQFNRYYNCYLEQLKAIQQQQQQNQINPTTLSFNCFQLLSEMSNGSRKKQVAVHDSSFTHYNSNDQASRKQGQRPSEQQPINLTHAPSATCFDPCPSSSNRTSNFRPEETITSSNNKTSSTASSSSRSLFTGHNESPTHLDVKLRPGQLDLSGHLSEFARLHNLSAVASALSWSVASPATSTATNSSQLSHQQLMLAAVAASQQADPSYSRRPATSSTTQLALPGPPLPSLPAPLQQAQQLNSTGRRRRGSRKCRKIYGMAQRQLWCTQCKWKKACSRFHYSAQSSVVAANVTSAGQSAARQASIGDHLKLLQGGFN